MIIIIIIIVMITIIIIIIIIVIIIMMMMMIMILKNEIIMIKAAGSAEVQEADLAHGAQAPRPGQNGPPCGRFPT